MDNNCKWIGDGEGCKEISIKKSYCRKHYPRVYLTMFSEMADYFLDKEIQDSLENKDRHNVIL